MTRVTVLGLGAMGSRMAANLIDAGHDVTVWNRTKSAAAPLVAKGAAQAETPRIAVKDAEVAVAIVSDDDASRAVWLDAQAGALHGFAPGAFAIESSTLTGAWVRELGEAASSAGIRFLDACVSGSRPQVEARQLIYFVGGAKDDFESIEPVLTAAGGAQVRHVGDLGAGSAVKLATNALLGVQAAAMAEGLALLRRAGVNELAALDVIGATFVCSPFAKGVGTLMANRAYDPLFATDLAEKDMRYALLAGQGTNLPVIAAARAVFGTAMDRGWAQENISSITKLYE